MKKQAYTLEKSEYLEKNPNWHIEDSPWKARQIMKMLTRNNLQPKTIAEIGCGAGEILNQLHQHLPDNTIEFSGYEIAPDAIALARERAKPRLQFYQENLLNKDVTFDLLLMIDVFEHVEDYINFVRESARKATYKIYHIPLDVSVSGVLRNVPGKTRDLVGHLHYFTKDTALSTLRDTDQEIVDFFYTPVMVEVNNKKISSKMLNMLRKTFYAASPDLSVKLFGGYSLLVLTK